MDPLLSLQNCQVTKSNKTYTLMESPKRFAKRQDKVSWVITSFKKRQPICVFHKKKRSKKKSNQNQNHKSRKECHEHYTIFMIQNILHYYHFKMKVACICIPKIMFILGYKCIDFSLYTNFSNLMFYLLSLGWEALSKS